MLQDACLNRAVINEWTAQVKPRQRRELGVLLRVIRLDDDLIVNVMLQACPHLLHTFSKGRVGLGDILKRLGLLQHLSLHLHGERVLVIFFYRGHLFVERHLFPRLAGHR